MHAASSAVVRIVMMSVAIAIYTAAVSASRWIGGTDANIGAGLLGFAGLIVISFGWALVDGRGCSVKDTIMSWSMVAATLAVVWGIVRAIADADSSLSVAESLVADLSLTFFFFGLVLVPASVGAVVGGVSRRGDLA